MKITTKRFDATDAEILEEIRRVFRALSETGAEVTTKDIAKALKAPETEVILFISERPKSFACASWARKKTIVIRAIVTKCGGKYTPGMDFRLQFRDNIKSLLIQRGPFMRMGYSGVWYLVKSPRVRPLYPTMFVNEDDHVEEVE